jgi:hypothetical protein
MACARHEGSVDLPCHHHGPAPPAAVGRYVRLWAGVPDGLAVVSARPGVSFAESARAVGCAGLAAALSS